MTHPGGRPTKFNQEICDGILKSVQDCLPLKLCAEENGIHYDTLREWINEGIEDIKNEQYDTDKAKFSVAMKKGVGDRQRLLLEKIASGENGWQGSAWILERRWWKYWSNKAADIDFNERLTALENEGKHKDSIDG